ncbi:hypothetical protein ACIBH1_35340 [Nonomuraea sp. NPDC050663]|uniref:hypothetical protein n=1 Tax=Nonomuraea sp. NPDC050663 TaxID=3364370 RepID=UPI0037A6B32D
MEEFTLHATIALHPHPAGPPNAPWPQEEIVRPSERYERLTCEELRPRLVLDGLRDHHRPEFVSARWLAGSRGLQATSLILAGRLLPLSDLANGAALPHGFGTDSKADGAWRASSRSWVGIRAWACR